MGALHEGHLSLLRRARAECESVIASVFVNPTQFGSGEDYETYPRTFEADCRKLEAVGTDLLFAPAAQEMYPAGGTSFVDVGELASRLDGASRPGHFRGVATIVSKLLHVVGPDVAYFGQKDAAQIAVLRKMIRDLNFSTQLVACPIIREPDGLAMSSRNVRLSKDERRRALVLYAALQSACWLAASGETSSRTLRTAMLSQLEGETDVRVDYAEVVNPDTLLPVEDTSQGALIAVAAWVGSTRLIDNALTNNLAVEHPFLCCRAPESVHA
jgi:pantoate--beta-alanine ligase